MSVATSVQESSELAQNATFFMCGCSACGGKTVLSEVTILSEVVSRNALSAQATVAVADEPFGTAVTVGGSVSGVINSTGDLDYFSVDLVAGQTYLFSLRGTGSTPVTDTFLVLYGTTGAFAAFDDDGGNDTNSLLTFTATSTGTYFLEASSFANPGDPGLGSYTIDVRQRGADSVGNTNATSVALSQGTTFGFRETGTDVDRYKVTLEAGKYYEFRLAAGADYATDFLAVPTGEIDTILRLRNTAGQIIASNDDINFPSDISSGLGFFATQSGTFYLDATGYSPQTGGYVIDFREVPITNLDPLDSINWFTSNNVKFADVGGVKTAYVYFGDSDENFGQTNDAGTGPMITIDWNAYEKGQVMKALEEFEKILGVNYVITDDVNQATFRLLKTESDAYGAYFFPQDPQFGADQGVGVFNVLSGGWNFDDQQSLEKGGFSFAVILHEFGHAHGLAHPHDRGGGSDVMLGVTGATGTLGVFDLNQGIHTVMSYNDAWQKHPDGPSAYTGAGIDNGWSGTLSAFDIAVLQQRYGVHAHNEGDNVYELADNVQDAFYETIWDSNGTDTIAYGGSKDAQIDLTAATLDYTATGGGVVSFVRNAPGTPSAEQIKGGYTIANGVVIENASGGSGDDVLIGNAAVNKLSGNAGDDVLMGNAGGDTLDGGAGFDTASYMTAAAGVTVVLANNGRGTVTGGDTDSLISIEQIDGSAFGDTMTGGTNNDAFNGGAGKDTLSGGNGADKLDGGADNDSVDGGNGNDQLFGRAGVDTVSGGTGNDLIDGGADADVLTGGSGNDMFIFQSAGHIGAAAGARDVIKDFVANLDKIDLSRLYSSDAAKAGFAFIAAGDNTALGAYDVKVTQGGNTTLVTGDVNGDGLADFALELSGKVNLKRADLVINEADWNGAINKMGVQVEYSAFHNEVLV